VASLPLHSPSGEGRRAATRSSNFEGINLDEDDTPGYFGNGSTRTCRASWRGPKRLTPIEE